MSIYVFVHIWFSLLEPSWAQICLCHLGSPTLLWQHCVHCVLLNHLQVLTLPAITSWLDITSQCFVYMSQHRGWLHWIPPHCRYFIFISCQFTYPEALLSCSACCPCTWVTYVALPRRSDWDPFGLSHAKRNLRQPCYSELNHMH